MDVLSLSAIISGMKIAADNKITKELLKEIVSAGLDLSEDQGKELLEKYKKNFNLNLSLLPVPLKKTEEVREAITDFLIHYTDLDALVLRCGGKTDAVAKVLVQDFEDTYEGNPANLKYAKRVLKNLAKKTVASVEEASVQEVNFLTAYMDRLADENRESHERMEKTLGGVQSTLGEIKDTVNEIAGKKGQEEKQNLHNLTLPPSMVDGATFVRTSDVEQVQQKIQKNQNLLLVNGFGGVGKTSVAKALFHKVKDSYHYVGWIEYERSLKESLLSTVRLYGEETDPDMRLDKILAFFAEHGKEIFLVIDNVDRADDALLSTITGMGMTLLLTSRLSNLPSYQEHPIGFLDEDGGVKLFYAHCKNINENEHLDTVKELVEMVQRHTLSIELIAKGYTASYGSLEKYHQALVEKGMTYPKLEINAGNEHVAATIAGHLKKLFDMQRLTEEQKRILYNLSYMPNRNLPGEICGWIQADENEMQRLADTGWIEAGDGTYYMHPIVRETVLLDEAVYPADVGKEFLTCIDEKRFFSQKDHYTVSWEKLDLAEAFVGHLTEEQMKGYANVYFYIAWYQERYGRYAKALEYYERSLEIRLELYGEKHRDVAKCYNNIGTIYYNQGNHKKALEYYEKSLEIRLELYGEKHGDVATSYNNIGTICYNQGNHKKALEHYEKSLEIRLELYGEKHGDVATSYNNIGSIYDDQGNHKKALEYYEKALEIWLELYGEKHGDVATSYNNIGYIHGVQGNPEKALEYLEKSLEIKLELHGEKHGDVATSYNNIGYIYRIQGNLEKALEYYEKAYEIWNDFLGPDHPKTKVVLLSIQIVKEKIFQ